MTEPSTVKVEMGEGDHASEAPTSAHTPEWVLVDGLPVIHRYCLDAGTEADDSDETSDSPPRIPTQTGSNHSPQKSSV
jgi:hypothetical protein